MQTITPTEAPTPEIKLAITAPITPPHKSTQFRLTIEEADEEGSYILRYYGKRTDAHKEFWLKLVGSGECRDTFKIGPTITDVEDGLREQADRAKLRMMPTKRKHQWVFRKVYSRGPNKTEYRRFERNREKMRGIIFDGIRNMSSHAGILEQIGHLFKSEYFQKLTNQNRDDIHSRYLGMMDIISMTHVHWEHVLDGVRYAPFDAKDKAAMMQITDFYIHLEHRGTSNFVWNKDRTRIFS